MKFIKFAEEVLRVPKSVTFWIMDQGNDYKARYCVNMSSLEKQDFMGEPTKSSIIRSEGYEDLEKAETRLNKLLELLNK